MAIASHAAFWGRHPADTAGSMASAAEVHRWAGRGDRADRERIRVAVFLDRLDARILGPEVIRPRNDGERDRPCRQLLVDLIQRRRVDEAGVAADRLDVRDPGQDELGGLGRREDR